MALIYNFEKRGQQSKFEYLYQCLKEDIINGKIFEGERMPSKRRLAEANNISVRTVVSAYEQLQTEGYLEARERSGYYVVSNFGSQLTYQKVKIPIPTPEEETEWFADFTVNTIVHEKFPYSTWAKVTRQVLTDNNQNLMKRGEFLGCPQLRYEIAKYLYHNRGIQVSPDNIVIGTGIEYLYSKLIGLLPANAVYAVENPGYRKIRLIYKSLGVKWTWVSMWKDGIHMGSLRQSGATVIHTSPEHHFPLSTVTSARRRQELLKWLEESPDRYIIEDDYDCEFRYSGHSIPALYGMDVNQRVIYMNTFSKTLSPGIRISYMILPPFLLKRYVDTANFFSNTSSNLEQHTLARFLRDGYFGRHINRMRKYYLYQGESLKNAILETPSIPVSEITGTETGTHLLVKLDTKLTDNEIKLRAKLKNINLRFLTEYCVGEYSRYRHTLILNYSGMDEKRMHEAVKMLGKIFSDDDIK